MLLLNIISFFSFRLLKWSVKNSEFVIAKVLETLHPCNCVLYTDHSVIVGCDKVFEINLNNFVIQGKFFEVKN